MMGRLWEALRKALRVLRRPVRRDRGLEGVVVQPYRGYGTEDGIYLMGRVFRQPAVGASLPAGSFLRELVDVVRRLARWGLGDVPVRAQWGGSEEIFRTDRDGYFHVDMTSVEPPGPGWQSATSGRGPPRAEPAAPIPRKTLERQRRRSMEHEVEILHTGFVTHDVRRFITTRPDGLSFEPGQGVEVALDREGWRDKGHPFTPTSQRNDPVFEFTIKEYPSHDGVTTRLHDLRPGDTLRMSDAFGTIVDRGPGTFIAGGAGVTPFLAIFRHMSEEDLDGSTLVFSNRTPEDVICEKELRHLLGDRCHLTCTDESGPGYDHRRVDRDWLAENIDDFGGTFYVCGPSDMVDDVTSALKSLGADADRIVVEE